MKNKRFGFSLAEMMIVLMLISVVMAASSPMITRKISRERSDKIFDMLNVDPPNAVEYVKGRNQRIYMAGRDNGYVGIRESGDTIPTNSVLFGYNNYEAATNGFVGLGFGTYNSSNSVALGYNAKAKTTDSVAIGYNAFTEGTQSIAIGPNAKAKKSKKHTGIIHNPIGATAIGYGATVLGRGQYSTAIGYNAKADIAHTIVLGTEEDVVYIPGNLVVEHSALIGRAANRNDNLYFRPFAREDGRHFAVLNAGDWKGEDSNIVLVQNYKNTDWLEVKIGPHEQYSTTREYWRDDYDDNSRAHIHFTDPLQGDETNTYKYSDIRLKNLGDVFTGGLEELNKLTAYNFTFKNDKEKTPQVGIIAQDLQKVFPKAVTEDKYGYLKIRWDEMFFSVINAVKELNTKITALADKYQNVSSELANLRETVQKQQAVIEQQQVTIDAQQSEMKNLVSRIEKIEKKQKKIKEEK